MRRLLFFCASFFVAFAAAQDHATLAIKVDQVGYPPSGAKLAMVTQPSQKFSVKRASDGAIVFAGKLTPPRKDANTGDMVQTADFSRLRTPGTYYLEVPGVGRSWKFSIGPGVFSRTYWLALRAFYGQRCGMEVALGPEFPGYQHPACHTKGIFHSSSGKQGQIESAGGWHDAGDYGRYLPPSSIATATLLWTWELFHGKVKGFDDHIPESGNGTPDILNEARWNLGWMLKMQDADGGVWHKQTSVEFPGFVMPEDDLLPSEVIGTGKAPHKSTCATAGLAATAAIAARVYRPFDAQFAAANLNAARQAWAWAERYPEVTFKNPPGVITGEYGDARCGDERLWAAAELWRTTGEGVYHRYFVENYAGHLSALESTPGEPWADLGPMALWTYALAGRQYADAQAFKTIRGGAIKAARQIAARTQSNPYRVSMMAKDFVWGSNGVAANYGMQLLIANRLAPDPAFVQAAADNLHYLLGRNTFSLSWVTQVGANSARHLHHRPSGGDNNPEPWPGLLAGGPNANRQDAVLKSLPDLPPGKIYRDEQDSYASNEVAINWQAMLVFLLAAQLP
jgi:endoglucanase